MLLLLLMALGLAQYDPGQAWKSADLDPKALAEAVVKSELYDEWDELQAEVAKLRKLDGPSAEEQADRVRSMLWLYTAITAPPTETDAGAIAREVKRSPFYADRNVDESANWLSRALERLLNLLNRRPNQNPGLKPLAIGQWLTYVAWSLLISAVVVFSVLAVKHYRWKLSLVRKATAVLEEDEPERSIDEWLELADRYEREGDFRLAVRSLYLACLLRFDEVGIARFDRGQTNWEHLSRIRQGGKMPEGLDFVTPTREFDRIWYGRHVRGRDDVELFRATYAQAKSMTTAVPT